jgi:hypothetical protein
MKVTDHSSGSNLERLVGGVGAAFFSLVYFVGPLWILFCLGALIVAPRSSVTHAAWVPLLISICVPPIPSPQLLKLWIFRCVPKFFQYKEICETDDNELFAYMKTRSVIFTAAPHGVISYVGICSAIVRADEPALLLDMPTAVATVILRFPFMKNVLGIFGLVPASKEALSARLRGGKHVVLYLGGIAELFLSSTTIEALYLKQRAGVIKLALQTGSDIVPIYLFGNTSVLSLVKTGKLAEFSRKFQVSFTLCVALRQRAPVADALQMRHTRDCAPACALHLCIARACAQTQEEGRNAARAVYAVPPRAAPARPHARLARAKVLGHVGPAAAAG